MPPPRGSRCDSATQSIGSSPSTCHPSSPPATHPTIFSLRHYTSAPALLASFRRPPPDEHAPASASAASPAAHPASADLDPELDPDLDPFSPASPADTRALSTSAMLSPTSTRPELFDFDRMIKCFEAIQQDHVGNPVPLPTSGRFVAAMREVNLLFDTLGRAFVFVREDLDRKISIIADYASEDPTNYGNLSQAIPYELSHSLAVRDASCRRSCSRTVLRLMWALKFANILLNSLSVAYNPDADIPPEERTLRFAVGHAYQKALADHHSWTLRRAVSAACRLLPSKETFMTRLGVQGQERDAYLSRLMRSMSPLVERMYGYYECNNLLDLP